MTDTATYSVPGMSCGHCRAAITTEVCAVPGVQQVARLERRFDDHLSHGSRGEIERALEEVRLHLRRPLLL